MSGIRGVVQDKSHEELIFEQGSKVVRELGMSISVERALQVEEVPV